MEICFFFFFFFFYLYTCWGWEGVGYCNGCPGSGYETTYFIKCGAFAGNVYLCRIGGISGGERGPS